MEQRHSYKMPGTIIASEVKIVANSGNLVSSDFDSIVWINVDIEFSKSAITSLEDRKRRETSSIIQPEEEI